MDGPKEQKNCHKKQNGRLAMEEDEQREGKDEFITMVYWAGRKATHSVGVARAVAVLGCPFFSLSFLFTECLMFWAINFNSNRLPFSFLPPLEARTGNVR